MTFFSSTRTRLLAVLASLGLALTFSTGSAQEGDGVDLNDPQAVARYVLQKSYENSVEFETEIAGMVEQGLSAQLGLELRIIFALRDEIGVMFPGLISELAEKLPTWQQQEAVVFTSAETPLALAAAMQGWLARDQGNGAEFERLMKEAMWQDPAVSQIVGNWVQSFHAEQKMANLVVPMDMAIAHSQGGQPTTLGQLVAGKKAVLLDFWATWCGPCMRLMPALEEKAAKLAPQGVVVAGFNTETAADAETVRTQRNISFPWLVEPDNQPYSTLFHIDSIPRMVLISAEGRVLYNGHPQDPKLAEALAKLEVTL